MIKLSQKENFPQKCTGFTGESPGEEVRSSERLDGICGHKVLLKRKMCLSEIIIPQSAGMTFIF